jgi:hypothetical protein
MLFIMQFCQPSCCYFSIIHNNHQRCKSLNSFRTSPRTKISFVQAYVLQYLYRCFNYYYFSHLSQCTLCVNVVTVESIRGPAQRCRLEVTVCHTAQGWGWGGWVCDGCKEKRRSNRRRERIHSHCAHQKYRMHTPVVETGPPQLEDKACPPASSLFFILKQVTQDTLHMITPSPEINKLFCTDLIY